MCELSTRFRVFLSKMQAVCHINTAMNQNGCQAKSMFNNIGSDVYSIAEEKLESTDDPEKLKKRRKKKKIKKRNKIRRKTRKANKAARKKNYGKDVKKGFKKLELVWTILGKATTMLKELWKKLEPVWLAINKDYKIWIIRKFVAMFLFCHYIISLLSFLLRIFVAFPSFFFPLSLRTSLYSRD